MGALTPLLLWAIMGYLFFAWYADEQRRENLPDQLTWTDVEREFARQGDREFGV